MNKERDTVVNVLPLSTLAMYRNGMETQRVKDRCDVRFGAASDADVQIWKVCANEVNHEL